MPQNKRIKTPPKEKNKKGSTENHPICLDDDSSLSRAAKSRKAAQWRRDQEIIWMEELTKNLPFPTSVVEKLDKATVLRLAISYLRMKKYTNEAGNSLLKDIAHGTNGNTVPTNGTNNLQLNEATLMLDALNGFLIFVSRKGMIYYISENVGDHLGIKQVDLLDHKVSEILHRDDVKEFAKQFRVDQSNKCLCVTTKSCRCKGTSKCRCVTTFEKTSRCCGSSDKGFESEDDDEDECDFDCCQEALVRERLFYVRFKCHVVKKGCKTRHTGFMLTQISGRVKVKAEPTQTGNKHRIEGLIAICRPMQSTPIVEIRLDGNMFMSRHDMSMTFTFCDPRILTLVGYEPQELIGKTAYQFHNPVDALKIHSCHSNLIVKGTSVSKYYRFLGKTGDWVWMQTRATIIYNTTNDPQYVVCMNYVIGEEEGRRYLMMETEDQSVKNVDAKGVIDITTVSSPNSQSAFSSGYSSADESFPNTPRSPNNYETFSPVFNTNNNTQDSGFNGQNNTNRGFDSDNFAEGLSDFNFEDLIEAENWLNSQTASSAPAAASAAPPNSAPPVFTQTSSSHNLYIPPTPCSAPASAEMGTFGGFADDVEMIDVEGNGGGITSMLANLNNINNNPDGKSILVNLLKVADKSGGVATNQKQVTGKENGIHVSGPAVSQAQQQPLPGLTTLQQHHQFLNTNQTSKPQQIHNVIGQPMVSGLSTSPNFVTPTTIQGKVSDTPLAPAVQAPLSLANHSSINSHMTVSMDAFNPGILGFESPMGDSMDDFALKFADSLVNQQMSDNLSQYLGDVDLLGNTTVDFSDKLLNDVNMCSSVAQPVISSSATISPNKCNLSQLVSSSPPITTSVPISMVTDSPSPKRRPALPSQQRYTQQQQQKQQQAKQVQKAAQEKLHRTQMQNAALRSLDDHSYTTKCPTYAARNGLKPATKPSSSILEHFLTTKRPLNPNKGSDYVLAQEGLSQLNLKDQDQSNLLKKLLTGEMDKNAVTANQRKLIANRRSTGSSPTSAHSSGGLDSDMCLDDTGDLGIDILSPDPASDLEHLWGSNNDEEQSTEIDEALQEQSRQDQAWLNFYLDELL